MAEQHARTWSPTPHSGRLELLGPDSGLSIETATAASGAVPGIWPSVSFNGHESIDAGMVSAANARLAAGHDRIVVLAPMYEGHAGIPSAQDDVDRLNQEARAFLAIPDEDSREAIGPNPYDPHRARRPPRRQDAFRAAPWPPTSRHCGPEYRRQPQRRRPADAPSHPTTPRLATTLPAPPPIPWSARPCARSHAPYIPRQPTSRSPAGPAGAAQPESGAQVRTSPQRSSCPTPTPG